MLVKNCLNDGGTSLVFLMLNILRDTFRCTRFVAQPRSSAPNIWQIIWYSDGTSESQHNIKNTDQADTVVFRDVMLCYQASGS